MIPISKGNVVEYLAIFAIGIYLVMQVTGMGLLSQTSPNYTTFYYRTLITGLLAVTGMVVYGIWYFTINPLNISLKMAVGIIAAFTLVVSMLTFAGNQIWPVPMAFGDPMQMTVLENYISTSIIPGFSEDLLYLAAFPMILSLFYFIPKTLFFRDVGRMEFIVVSVIACVIASTGYMTWVIPGFTSSHVPAYGNLQNAYSGAWIFSTGQSLIYLFTGVFAPVTHIIHNMIITYQSLYMVVVG
jgi:hypothetical protein